ncbi:MAG: MFS transporter, partial [Solirubrobacteraceae bacterium]
QFSSRVASLSATAPPAAVAHAQERPLVVDVGGFPAAQRRRARDVLVSASVDSFHLAIGISAGLTVLAGVISLLGVANPRRTVAAEHCSGGALCGASSELATAGSPSGQP